MPRPPRTVGIPYEWMTPAEIKERWPLVRTDDLKGAIYHPTDGYINPADVTMAMAKGARQRGVSIERKWQVDGYAWTGAEWRVSVTKMVEKGGNLVPSEETAVITAEHVVTATGNHAQRTARLLGIKIPAIPVEHQYIVTEPDPALAEWRAAGNPEHPVLRDATPSGMSARNAKGWILGPYEHGAPACFEYDVPDSFRADLFPARSGTDRGGIHEHDPPHPDLGNGGPQGRFQTARSATRPTATRWFGPAPGLRNMWLAEGFSFGITAAGGHRPLPRPDDGRGRGRDRHGRAGTPSATGRGMTTEYAARKNEECYAHVFILHHPG